MESEDGAIATPQGWRANLVEFVYFWRVMPLVALDWLLHA